MARRPQCYRRKTDYDMHVERTAQYMYGTPAGQFTGSMCVNYGILRRECKSSGELPQLIGYTERGGRYKRRWAGRSKTNYSNTEGRGKLGMYGMATEDPGSSYIWLSGKVTSNLSQIPNNFCLFLPEILNSGQSVSHDFQKRKFHVINHLSERSESSVAASSS